MAIDETSNVGSTRWKSRLLPHIVDYLAEVNPDEVWAEYPVSPLTYDEGYRKVTYGDFANAMNGIAWALHESLGSGKDFEPVAYIGPNDLRYPAAILGAIKAGYVMFLSSPRNSIAAQTSLFTKLKCKTMLSPNPRPAPTTAILSALELRVVEMPSVNDLLEKHFPNFPFEKTYAEACSEPLWIIHTSGSTGIPKPLVFTHETMARHINITGQDPPPGSKSQDRMILGKRAFLTFPPFHGAYLLFQVVHAVCFGAVMIAPASIGIASAEALVEGLKKAPADVGLLVPSIVEELSRSPTLLAYCAKHLEAILYCGGDLPQAIGDSVSSKITLRNQYGASEIGIVPIVLPNNLDREDWKYIQFHPALGTEFRHVTDGIHELIVVRDPKLQQQQPTFTIFPQLQEYATSDLWLRHPSKDKPDLWKWLARADDIIVFLNGEKTNPVSMEQYVVARSQGVKAALVVGAQRFQAALLIESETEGKEFSPSGRAAFIERIWPTIEEANEVCPAHARIAKSHILFTHPEKPMLRAGKGTVQRSGTLQLYAKEIDKLYADADTMSAEVDGEAAEGSVDLDDVQAVSKFIKTTLTSTHSWSDFDDDENFFNLGLDSLQSLMTLRKLRRGLAMPTLALSTIYTNPSISTLTSAVIRMAKQHHDSQTLDEDERHQERKSFLKEYHGMIDQMPIPTKINRETGKQTIILTGSTGALGSFILHTLLATPTTEHVYCVNRSADGLSLQKERNKRRGLPVEFDTDRVTFLTGDLSQKQLGLMSETYSKLLDTASLIIHNAWPVNFNLSLSSFRPQLRGMINLINFAASGPNSPHLFFISSISSVLSYRNASLRTPEQTIHEDFAPGPNGYAESKYISERLLDHAAQRLSIKTSYARVGQIAGAVSSAGLWNTAEWFPSLVISSLYLGAVPDSLGSSLGMVDWVPIDLLSEVLVELALSQDHHHHHHQNGSLDGPANAMTKSNSNRPRVFHPLNPHRQTWETIQPIVIDELSSLTSTTTSINNTKTKPVETIPLDAWIARVRTDIESAAGGGSNGKKPAITDAQLESFLKLNPAVKLLGFYEDVLSGTAKKQKQGGQQQMNELETTQTQKSSAKLRALEAVKPEWIRKWVREWVGTLPAR